jgi:CRP-like cAMP-binding protein
MHSACGPVELDQLGEVPLFAQLDRNTVAQVARGSWTVEHGRSARILGRGDHLDGMYSVFEGRLKLYMLSCNGDERVLRVLQPGDSFGEAIMFNAIPSPVFVETLSPVRLGYFPREVIIDALAGDPDFMVSMLRGMSAMMRELIHDLETCCLQSAVQRTVSYLLRGAESASASNDTIHLPAPKAVVASTLNISAETFSRELHRLQDEGYIEIERRTIRLRDRAGLLALIDGSSPPRRGH